MLSKIINRRKKYQIRKKKNIMNNFNLKRRNLSKQRIIYHFDLFFIIINKKIKITFLNIFFHDFILFYKIYFNLFHLLFYILNIY